MKKLLLILVLLGLCPPRSLKGQTPEPVVHGVLFYSPTCPHCHQVITEHLIPLQNQYGRQLVILGMDTTQPWASALYWEAIRFYKVPEEDWAVPLLVVGEEVMVGGFEIPDRFPTMIEEGLAAGGIDLPNYPALVAFAEERDMLDPRYPERLIARQASEPESDPTPSSEDSVVSEEPVSAVDTAAGEGLVAAANPAELGDTVTRGVGDPQDARPNDSAAGVGNRRDPRVESIGGAEGREPERGMETQVPEGSPDSAVSPVPIPQGTVSSEPAPEPLESLGLSEAARDMESMTMLDRFNLDRVGNSLSVLVLLGMVLSLILRGYPPTVRREEWPGWVIPVLVLVGAGAAAYLSFIEVTQTEAVCGPVGDCNTVNQSEYAFLFGVLPVGVLGLVGYGMILTLWGLARVGSGTMARMATLGLWGAALFGTLFSVYLTFLEPFVIGATCAWCLTSAVVMTLLLWATAPMAARVWSAGTPASLRD